jgi:tRNA pseudouridine38-40 synthase
VTVVKLVIAYDGTGFHGWARQQGVRTVQGAIEDVLGRILGEVPPLSVAGRTDAGVHAEGQVASFQSDVDPVKVQRAINGILAPEIVVRSADRAPAGFDARRSATGREYRYRIDTSEVASPFTARYVWHRPGRLAVGNMQAAARLLEGQHDFTSFCRPPSPPASTVRTLRRLAVSRLVNVIDVRAVADGFLHQMVRSLVGTLVRVGEGRLSPEAMPKILAAGDRAAAGPVAPPHGLTLVRVLYGRRRRPRSLTAA